jgi:hypothetical protein
VPVSGIGVPTCRSLHFKRTSHQRCQLSGMYLLGSAMRKCRDATVTAPPSVPNGESFLADRCRFADVGPNRFARRLSPRKLAILGSTGNLDTALESNRLQGRNDATFKSPRT